MRLRPRGVRGMICELFPFLFSIGGKLRRLILTSLVLCLTTIQSGPASAELLPAEVAILANRDSRESRAVAAYYAKVRGIPTDNILVLELPAETELSREQWESKVRPEIRRWLAQSDRLSKLRCFVTVWDVPLRITAETDLSEVARVVQYLRQERKDRVAKINAFTEVLARLAGGTELPPALGPDAGLDQVQQRLDTTFGAAQSEISKIGDQAQQQPALQQLQSIYFQSVGLNMMTQSLARQIQAGTSVADPRVRSEFDTARGRTIGLREGRAAMEGVPFGLDREPQLLALIQLSDGIYGTIAWIDEQIAALEKNESFASFDSELSLVAWPSYHLVRWQPNLLHYRYDETAIRDFKKTMMVSRLEAPTLQLTRAIIDQAIETEKTGLQGKVYLDARGLAKLEDQVQQGSYQDYDQALLKAADFIQKHSDLEVVLDAKQDLFAPDSAPDAALYCGWYSLAKYVDAFTWKTGAVGYHMASGEATTLRDVSSQVWCKRMLEDGVCATVGPVAEPYITAFPRPNEFFGLLLSGKYTLAETYYRCKPFNSWTMILVGDPLYTPYKSNSPLRTDNLDPLMRRIIDGPSAALTNLETPSADAAAPPPEGEGTSTEATE